MKKHYNICDSGTSDIVHEFKVETYFQIDNDSFSQSVYDFFSIKVCEKNEPHVKGGCAHAYYFSVVLFD